ncbi:hypothetical protein V2G26_017686 [Clonostachys chloroleuca]
MMWREADDATPQPADLHLHHHFWTSNVGNCHLPTATCLFFATLSIFSITWTLKATLCLFISANYQPIRSRGNSDRARAANEKRDMMYNAIIVHTTYLHSV